MAGTFIVTETLDWLPAGWVFDNAMEELAHFVEDDRPDLARDLLASRTSVSGGYFDLSTRDAGCLKRLSEAAQQVVDAVRSRGPHSFLQPQFFDGYLAQLEELSTLLAESTRSSESKESRISP